MKNLLLVLLLGLSFIACKKELIEEPVESLQVNATPAQAKIGDPNRLPNLYIPEDEGGWAGGTRMGLVPAYKTVGIVFVDQYLAEVYNVPVNSQHVALKYECLIANGIKGEVSNFVFDRTGYKDFVVDRSEDGIASEYSSTSYNFPSMLSIKLFKNGTHALPTTKVIKQNFWVATNEGRIGFWNAPVRDYESDTMAIHHGGGDLYYNKVLLPSQDGVAVDGLYVLVVEINPDKVIVESNYTDNRSIFPFRMTGGQLTHDPSAVQANLASAPTNFTGVLSGKGNNKIVTLSWNSTADHVHLWFNGQPVPSEDYYIYEKSWVVKVPANFKSGTFTIKAHNPGVGSATAPISITVNNK